MSNVNIRKLTQQSEELYSLIRATNRTLQDPTPVSELQYQYEEKVSDLAPQVWNAAKMTLATRRNPKELIMTVAVVGAAAAVGWVGATGIDAVRNNMAKSKARRALLGYYEQLAAKQSLIIEEQQRISQEMALAINQLAENEAESRQKIAALQSRQAELTELLLRFNKLKQQVEK